MSRFGRYGVIITSVKSRRSRTRMKGERRSRSTMIHFVNLISRQGKVRLAKWYSPYQQKERSTVIQELSGLIPTRGPKLCNFVEWKGYKVVYRRYASLYFCICVDPDDNELEILEIIHHFVEILDRYFGSVCELDLIFNFHKAYYILDEILIAGELQESSKKTVARLIAAQDSLVETAKEEASSISNMMSQAMWLQLPSRVSWMVFYCLMYFLTSSAHGRRKQFTASIYLSNLSVIIIMILAAWLSCC
ncbi:unnamed protein product, partial [Musa hybrid cultivar]